MTFSASALMGLTSLTSRLSQRRRLLPVETDGHVTGTQVGSTLPTQILSFGWDQPSHLTLSLSTLSGTGTIVHTLSVYLIEKKFCFVFVFKTH